MEGEAEVHRGCALCPGSQVWSMGPKAWPGPTALLSTVLPGAWNNQDVRCTSFSPVILGTHPASCGRQAALASLCTFCSLCSVSVRPLSPAPFLSLLPPTFPCFPTPEVQRVVSPAHRAAWLPWHTVTDTSAHCLGFDDSSIVSAFPFEWMSL